MAKKQVPIAHQIMIAMKRAIEESGKTRYQIAKETRVDEGTLSKFVRGQRSLGLKAVDKLADCLGLELTVTLRQKKG